MKMRLSLVFFAPRAAMSTGNYFHNAQTEEDVPEELNKRIHHAGVVCF
jgi:hypothetical protein